MESNTLTVAVLYCTYKVQYSILLSSSLIILRIIYKVTALYLTTATLKKFTHNELHKYIRYGTSACGMRYKIIIKLGISGFSAHMQNAFFRIAISKLEVRF